MAVVIGGTLAATSVRYSPSDLFAAFRCTLSAFLTNSSIAEERFQRLLEFSKRARAESILALETYLYRESDPFFRKCLELLVDGLLPKDLRKMVLADLSVASDRNNHAAEIYTSMAATAPAMGLIGTIIGLVQMLKQLNDPASLGPAMAIALLTTFYGVIIAHLICYPLASKLQGKAEEERLLREMTIEGIASIAEGMNPRLIEERLGGFIPKYASNSF